VEGDDKPGLELGPACHACHEGHGHFTRYLFASVSSQKTSKGIMEKCIDPFGFECSVLHNPKCSVRDIFDRSVGHPFPSGITLVLLFRLIRGIGECM